MNISLTTDVDFIVKCVHTNWESLKDDEETSKEMYFPPMQHLWVRVEDYGVFLLEKKNLIMSELHTALLPSSKGQAIAIGKEALQWAFNNLTVQRLITSVPEFNPLALRMALKCGFKVYGTNPSSFQKDGTLYSQTLLGINKQEALCR